MSEHNAFLRLAATAVDFQLDPHEARALGQHLQGCDQCRHTAESLRGDAAALRSLPRRSPSPRIAAAIARAARGEARPTRSPLLLLGLGFLLVAGLAGAVIGGAAIRQALESDGPAPTPGPTDPAIVVPSTVPSPITEPSAPVDPRLGVEWQVVDLVPDSDGTSGTSANAVTANEAGFIAVGRTCQPDQSGGELQCWGGVQLSSDGTTWESVPRQPGLEIGAYYPTSGPGADMIGVAARPDAIVAIGYALDGGMTIEAGGVFRPAVWVSADGRTWARAADDGVFEGARFSDIAATDDRFVIVGAVYGPDAPRGQPRGAIWTSVDGHEWQRAPDGPVFDVGGYLDTGEEPASGGPRRVMRARGGILSTGAVCNDRGIDCQTTFWSSPDGSTWERVVLEEPNVTASDIAATADGFIAVGIDSNPGGCGVDLRCTAAVFTSTDGRSWQRGQVDVPEGLIAPDAFSDVVVVGGRMIAIGEELEPDGVAQSQEPWLWWSTDGILWTPIEGVAADLGHAYWQPIAASADRIVSVGDINQRVLVSPPE